MAVHLQKTTNWLPARFTVYSPPHNNISSYLNEALPGVLGNRGTRAFISGEQGNKGQLLRGTGEPRQYWGTGNIENKFSIFGEQGNKPIYFRGTREQVPPPPHKGTGTPPPPPPAWEGLLNLLKSLIIM